MRAPEHVHESAFQLITVSSQVKALRREREIPTQVNKLIITAVTKGGRVRGWASSGDGGVGWYELCRARRRDENEAMT